MVPPPTSATSVTMSRVAVDTDVRKVLNDRHEDKARSRLGGFDDALDRLNDPNEAVQFKKAFGTHQFDVHAVQARDLVITLATASLDDTRSGLLDEIVIASHIIVN